MDDQVAEAVKTERLAAAQRPDHRPDARFRHNRSSAARCDVLIEKPGRMPGQIGGRSPYLQAVHMDGA